MQIYSFECPTCKTEYDVRCTFAEYDKMLKDSPPVCETCNDKLKRTFAPQIHWNTSGGTRGKAW